MATTTTTVATNARSGSGVWFLSSDPEITVEALLINLGTRSATAIMLGVTGAWGIQLLERLLERFMAAYRLESGLIMGARITLRATLWLALSITLLGILGIDGTSFAVLLAATMLAVALAASGLLANVAAGACLRATRPFREGDTVAAAGITGEVVKLGIVCTRIHRADNVCVTIGNHRVVSDSIVNYSVNAYRRVDIEAQLPEISDTLSLMDVLSSRVRGIRNVVSTPAPQVTLMSLNARGARIAVQPSCHHKDYWQVHSDTMRIIQATVQEFRGGAPARQASINSA